MKRSRGSSRRTSNPGHTPRRKPSSFSSASSEMMIGGDDEDDDDEEQQSGSSHSTSAHDDNDDTSLLQNIASFLTLSDAASLLAFNMGDDIRQYHHHHESRHQYHHIVVDDEQPAADLVTTPADSWAVGLEFDDDHGVQHSGLFSVSSSWSIATPITPALVAISPGATPADDDPHDDQAQLQGDYCDDGCWLGQDDDDDHDDSSYMQQRVLQILTRRWAQENVAMAIFAHPGSLRSFCLKAYAAAQQIRTQQQQQQQIAMAKKPLMVSSSPPDEDEDEKESHPETQVYPTKKKKRARKARRNAPGLLDPRLKVVRRWIDVLISENIPLSVFLQLAQTTREVGQDTTLASLTITDRTVQGIINAIANSIRRAGESMVDIVQNPGHYLGAVISMQFTAVERTGGAFATGLQSVATGVGSASNCRALLIHRWSAASLVASGAPIATPVPSAAALNSLKVQKELLRKLSNLDHAGRVVAYHEVADDTGGLTDYAMSRTRKMMHYSISLRPFVATVVLPSEARNADGHIDESDLRSVARSESDAHNTDADGGSGDNNGEEEESPFMRTPQSFPTTPRARNRILRMKERKSHDTLFLARDKLRIHGALESEDERTRNFAQMLRETKSLANFVQPADHENDIELSYGKHVATKKGSTMYYSTVRSMVPLWRNSYVYFEMYVVPRAACGQPLAIGMPALSVGLSTQEMPPNTLVGAWQGSVGIYTTGQILSSGQWFSPRGENPQAFAYTESGIVGVLVFMNQDTLHETWDGVMITAGVTFSVNGRVVPPSVAVHPALTLSPSRPPTANSNDDHGNANSPSFFSSSANTSGHDSSLSVDPRLLHHHHRHHRTVDLIVAAAEDVFPTVTLQSAGTAVMCRFSSEDLFATSREMIGAPPDVPIYAVDGSVIHLD